jgi:hypothetical protein
VVCKVASTKLGLQVRVGNTAETKFPESRGNRATGGEVIGQEESTLLYYFVSPFSEKVLAAVSFISFSPVHLPEK